jgi:hypothetical protein
MHRTFIRDSRTFHQVADIVAAVALPGYTRTLRDGLNLGGGDYYCFESGPNRVLLVHNDEAHPDVFVPEYVEHRFSIYVYQGDPFILEKLCSRLNDAGLSCVVGDG